MSGLLEGGISQKDEDSIRAEAKAERTREIRDKEEADRKSITKVKTEEVEI